MSRPRTSFDDLKLQGGGTNLTRAYRRTPHRAEFGVPSAPPDLSREERAQWDAVVKILSARGTLTKGHTFVLEQFAVVRARWSSEAEALAREGMFVDVVRLDKNLKAVTINVLNPRLKIVQQCERQLLALTRELGLASAREQVEQPYKGAPKPGTGAALFPEIFADTEQVQ